MWIRWNHLINGIKDMIKVYFANIELLNESEYFEKGFEAVHSMRQKKVLRCKQEMDKKRSLLVGLLLKLALETEGYVYETLDFALEEHGKPVIKNIENVFFSLSHTGKYAFCCISDHPIGLDAEGKEKSFLKEEKIERLYVMAKKIFSEKEYEKFLDCDDVRKVQLFLKYWTRKESYSKSLGEGIRMDFSKIDTESMENAFWSDWLEEDCYASIYSAQGNYNEVKIQKVLDFEI